jgi:hypothetical protein
LNFATGEARGTSSKVAKPIFWHIVRYQKVFINYSIEIVPRTARTNSMKRNGERFEKELEISSAYAACSYSMKPRARSQ